MNRTASNGGGVRGFHGERQHTNIRHALTGVAAGVLLTPAPQPRVRNRNAHREEDFMELVWLP